MPLHPADRIVDRLHVPRNFGLPLAAGEPFDRGGRHIDREQQRPDFIVQIARKIGALLRLQRQQSLI